MNKIYVTLLTVCFAIAITLGTAQAIPTWSGVDDTNIVDDTYAFDGNFSTRANYPWYWGEGGKYANLTWYDNIGSNESYEFDISIVCGNVVFENVMVLKGFNGSNWINITKPDCDGAVPLNHTINVTDAQNWTNGTDDILLSFSWYCKPNLLGDCALQDGLIYEIWITTPTPPTPPLMQSNPEFLIIPLVLGVILLIFILGTILSIMDGKELDLGTLVKAMLLAIVGGILIGIMFTV